MYQLRCSRSIKGMVLLIASSIAFAHAGMEHVMGTVAAVKDNSVIVDTVTPK